MSIKFDSIDENELKDQIQSLNKPLILCKLKQVPSQNNLLMNIPVTFPEYELLAPSLKCYFYVKNNEIHFSLNEPRHYNCIKRTIQWYGTNEQKYFRTPVPVQYRKKYNLDLYKTVHMIETDIQGEYRCVFV